MKKQKAAALLLGFTLTAFSFAACNVEFKKDAETSEATEAIATEEKETEAMTENETESTEPSEKPTEASEETEPDISSDVIGEGYGPDRYTAYRDFATELKEEDDDLLFNYMENYSFDDIYRFDLTTYCPETGEVSVYYCSDDGFMHLQITYVIDESSREDALIAFNSYEDFMKLPFMTARVPADLITDSVPDGFYFGDVLAVNEDLDTFFISLSEPVILTEEEFLNLKVGDKIRVDLVGLEYVTVESVDESKTDWGRVRFNSTSDSGYDYCINISKCSYTPDETDYYLYGVNDYPVTINEKYIAMPIADNCMIDDTNYLAGAYIEDAKKYAMENNLTTPFGQCSLWYFNVTESLFDLEPSNGWIQFSGLGYPTIVKDGKISEVHFYSWS